MQITVSFNVDVPERGDIDIVEPLVIAASRKAMAEALQAGSRAYEAQFKFCPHCRSDNVRHIGVDQRTLLTSFGRVVLSMSRMRCLHCKSRYRPADGYLACLGETNITSVLSQASMLTGMACSYDMAVKVLARLCGVRLSAEQVRRLTMRAKWQVREELP